MEWFTLGLFKSSCDFYMSICVTTLDQSLKRHAILTLPYWNVNSCGTCFPENSSSDGQAGHSATAL